MDRMKWGGRERRRSEGRRDSTGEPFRTHNNVNVRQWGLTTSAGVSVGFISMRLQRETLSVMVKQLCVHLCVFVHVFNVFLFFFQKRGILVLLVFVSIANDSSFSTTGEFYTRMNIKQSHRLEMSLCRWLHFRWTQLINLASFFFPPKSEQQEPLCLCGSYYRGLLLLLSNILGKWMF